MERQNITFRPARKRLPETEDDNTEKGRWGATKVLLGITAVAIAFSLVSSYQATGDPFSLVKERLFNPFAPDGVVVGSDSPAWYTVNTAIFSQQADKQAVLEKPDDTRINLARKYGFHMVDYRPYIAPIGLSKSEPEVVSHTSDYFKQFGIEFLVPADFYKTEHSTDKSDPTIHQLKNSCLNLITSLSRKPKEILLASGLKSVQVVPDDDKRVHTYNPSSSEGYISYSDLLRNNTGAANGVVDSEIAMGIDYAINGVYGSLNDKTYEGANGAKEYDPYHESHDLKTCYANKISFYAKNLSGLDADSYFAGAERSELLLVRLEAKLPNITKYLQSVSTSDWSGWLDSLGATDTAH